MNSAVIEIIHAQPKTPEGEEQPPAVVARVDPGFTEPGVEDLEPCLYEHLLENPGECGELVTKMGYEPAEPQDVLGPKLVKEYNIQKLETCWTCHR